MSRGYPSDLGHSGPLWMEVQASAMEIDGDPIMGTVTKTTGKPFYLLNLAVESFHNGVGKTVMDIGYDVLKMSLDRARGGFDRVKARMHGPQVPTLEELPCPGLTVIIPQMPKVFFDRPCPGNIQVGILQASEFRLPPFRYVFRIPKPQVFGPFQNVASFLTQLFVLLLSDLVDSFRHLLHHVKTIKHNLAICIRHMDPVAAMNGSHISIVTTETPLFSSEVNCL